MYIRTNPIFGKILSPFVSFCEWFGGKYPKTLVRIRYFVRFHKLLNFKNPKTLNEKILYLTLCTDTSEWTLCADKFRVREYIRKKGFGDNLVKLYGKWDSVEDCDFATLPNSFVLKCNHGSGDVVIVHDKRSIDEKRIKDKFRKALSKPYGALEGGLHYMRIKPCLIAEELLDTTKQDIDSSSLIDYKVWCFNGKPRYIWTCANRTTQGLYNCLFDTQWNDCTHFLKYDNHYIKPSQLLPKPFALDRMLEIASKLAAPF
ncbi:MAG: ATP-grasp fold amidoligase family protein, partial [Muribaculaceae bacterium]